LARHILIVDDEPISVQFLGKLLKKNGYEVHVANSGELAFEIAGEIQPDLILLDISMPPGMDGIETCRHLKSDEDICNIPVIFLTGKDDEESMVNAFDAGGADYVLKPFDTRVLLARVRTHIELGVLSHNQEVALAERTLELHEANAKLRRLAMEMSLIEEREKKRLAGDLHDSPMQKLALAQIQIESACLAREEDKAGEHVSAGLGLMRDALQELRLLQFELSPPILYQSGLGPALKWLATHASRRWSLPFSFAGSGDLPELDQQLSIVLFQFARELVTNVVKHSNATQGCIRLVEEGPMLLLTVEDDGVGFEPSPSKDKTHDYHGFGLFSIRERLNLLGGSLEIDSKPVGSRTEIRVPATAMPAGGETDFVLDGSTSGDMP